jgi:hypothetical protein
MKARTVDQIDAAIVRQQCGKHVSAVTDNDITIEAVSSTWSVLRLYNEDRDK